MSFNWKSGFGWILLDIINKNEPAGRTYCDNVTSWLVPGQLTYTYLSHGGTFMLANSFLTFEPILFLSIELNDFDGFF